MFWQEQIASVIAISRVYRCYFEGVYLFNSFVLKPVCAVCVYTCMRVYVYIYIYICMSVHGPVYFIFAHSLEVHLLTYVSIPVHGSFFFLQIKKLSAKRNFLFLNLARTWYRLPLQFHPVCIINRLMASDSLRDTLQASDGKRPPPLSLIMDFSFI